MNVNVKFKTIVKTITLDYNDVDVFSDEIEIKRVDYNIFSSEELNRLANTNGVCIYFITKIDEDSYVVKTDKANITIHKSLCSVEYCPSDDGRVKYLTEQIDKMSTELNNLINK